MAFALGTSKYVPPPNIREDTVKAYAHCTDPRCPGVAQQIVAAVRTTQDWTFESRGGGDDPNGIGNLFLKMVENSYTSLRFTDPEDLPCPHCGTPRELSSQERPVIPMQIGGANALLRLQEMGVRFDPERQEQITKGAPETPEELLRRRYINDELSDDEYAAKRSVLAGEPASDDRIAALEAQLAKLLGAQDGPPKRGPGRPRREPE